MGDSANFEGGNPDNHPVKDGVRHVLGLIHKGGLIVPLLIWVNLIIIIFSIERGITIAKARGRGRLSDFIRTIRELIASNRVDEAIAECDRQRGSLANVVRSGLLKYKNVEMDGTMDKEAKVTAIQKDLEESTALELPMLSKNLVIISTCASIATLVGLIGTVLGMIRSFSALANAGAPDTNALSTGISEALINTALGISGSAVAIVMYNFYSARIDALTYGMDEANFSIVQTFAAKHNG
jgi:biopolymer transport protein ExbB